MSVRSSKYDFTAKGLAYFLFKKKTCPKCGEQMKRDKCRETIDGSVYNTNLAPPCIQGRQAKHYFYRLACQECGAEFTSTESSKQEGDLK